MRKYLYCAVIFILVCVLAFSGYQVYTIFSEQTNERNLHEYLLNYKPVAPSESQVKIINQGVIDLQLQYPDVAGWLTVHGTGIDYPFVQAKDNDTYLRRNLDQEKATAGTVFMDYRCNKNFTDFSTVLYGHHMKDGSMFGTLNRFNDKAFFEHNKTGTVFLPHETYTLEIFAYAVVSPNDHTIYSFNIHSDAEKQNYFSYVKEKARFYREIPLAVTDKIVTLSTCSYEWNDARMVLICKIK